MTFFNLLPNKVLIKDTIPFILTANLYLYTPKERKMKNKLNNLFFYIGKTFNNYDMLLTCIKTELSQRRYDTAKKIISTAYPK